MPFSKLFNFFDRRKRSADQTRSQTGFPIGEFPVPVRDAAPQKAKACRGERIEINCKSYYNLHMEVIISGLGQGFITVERLGNYYYICLRNKEVGRKVLRYIPKREVGRMAGLISQGSMSLGQDIVYRLLSVKFNVDAVKPNVVVWDRDYKPRKSRYEHLPWSLGFGLWLRAHRKEWGRSITGVLIAEKKRKNGSYSYYLAERLKGSRRSYKHYYLEATPWEHLELAFSKPQRYVEYRPILDYLQSKGVEILNSGMVTRSKLVPKWLIKKRIEEKHRVHREDEGIIGEAIEEAEDWGWGEVELEYLDDGDWEAYREVEDFLGEN